MTFAPIARTSVADSVCTQISAQVFDGRLVAGEDLPGERALAEAVGATNAYARLGDREKPLRHSEDRASKPPG